MIEDGAVRRLHDDMELDNATVDAVRARVRPIFTTTLTSLAGLLPMVVARGIGAELYRGFGAIVLGGLAVSTVLAMFVVPALFASVWGSRAHRRWNRNRR